MKLKPIVASLALIAGSSAIAGGHGLEPSTDSHLDRVLDRNQNRYDAKDDHYRRVRWSGLIQGHVGFSTLDPSTGAGRFATERTTSDIWASRAIFNMDATVNDYVEAHISTNLLQLAGGNTFTTNGRAGLGIYNLNDSAAYEPFNYVNEAFVTMRNFDVSPVYARMGLAHAPFGHYSDTINRVPAPLTQLLTQTTAPLVEMGFVDTSGVYGNVYFFRGNLRTAGSTATINNGGASLGWCMDGGDWGIHTVVDYMYNMVGGVNAMGRLTNGIYDKAVGGLSAIVMGHFASDFDFRLQYVTALRKISTAATSLVGAGDRPAAMHAGFGYTFDMGGYESRFGASYQQSFDARLVGAMVSAGTGVSQHTAMPEIRVQADWCTEVWKDTHVSLTYVWDRAYRAAGVANRNAHTGLLTVSALFS